MLWVNIELSSFQNFYKCFFTKAITTDITNFLKIKFPSNGGKTSSHIERE